MNRHPLAALPHTLLLSQLFSGAAQRIPPFTSTPLTPGILTAADVSGQDGVCLFLRAPNHAAEASALRDTHRSFARGKEHTDCVRQKNSPKGDGRQIRVREKENLPGPLVWRCYNPTYKETGDVNEPLS